MLSQKNLIFTPSNWSIPQTITLTGIDNNSIEIPQMYNVNIGKIISDDSDYSKIDINNLKFEHKNVGLAQLESQMERQILHFVH